MKEQSLQPNDLKVRKAKIEDRVATLATLPDLLSEPEQALVGVAGRILESAKDESQTAEAIVVLEKALNMGKVITPR